MFPYEQTLGDSSNKKHYFKRQNTESTFQLSVLSAETRWLERDTDRQREVGQDKVRQIGKEERGEIESKNVTEKKGVWGIDTERHKYQCSL